MRRLVIGWFCIFCFCAEHRGSGGEVMSDPKGNAVSYSQDIRPIFQAHCVGCHQPAKSSGDYVMTSFESLVGGGESGTAAIVPGQPDESYLLELVTPVDGDAEMPAGRDPLSAENIALVRRWIEEGARNDAPNMSQVHYDVEHPPTYTSPPVISSIDCSPDGNLLAVAGFHEVLLHRMDGSGLLARLVGMSERIESATFSPDGHRLAVVGGSPGRGGELQIWDVVRPEGDDALPPAGQWRPDLLLSIPVTYDTIYGGTWSPDGKLIAVGCADNSVRAYNAESGKQVLFQGAHSDWVLDTVFSNDGQHLVSVGRDMTAKLTEVATERFVDNITSITPGALKGGIQAVARHPNRSEIVIGGSDGIPKVYRMFRETARRIGDDANLIRRLPALKGRVFAVSVSRDGRRIASGSSLDGAGQVAVDSYEFDTSLPDDIKKIMSKVATSRSAAEKKKLDSYHMADVRRIALIDVPTSVYALAFSADSTRLFVAGSDGMIRIVSVDEGTVLRQFPAVGNLQQSTPRTTTAHPRAQVTERTITTEVLPDGAVVTELQVTPPDIHLANPFEYVQLVVTATLKSGAKLDVTRMVKSRFLTGVGRISPRGVVTGVSDGQGDLQLALGERVVTVPVLVSGQGDRFQPDFVRDVAPMVAKMGCNQGTCHGAAKGKNGFKLSLRGYDPVADIRAFTDDHASRRANVASPDDSLMLLKATSAVPHVGGQLTRVGEDYYEVIRQWLAGGARLNRATPRVQSIAIYPLNPTVESIGAQQQIRVVATFDDGARRDVSREAFITSGNTEVATTDSVGLMTSVRRGEAPVLARYEGAYAATTLTVMGDRTGFQWRAPETYNEIDKLTAAKWQRLKIQPSDLCTDAEFIRRVSLDLTGLPPTVEAVRAFLEDERQTRVKRDDLVDRLIGSEPYIDFWTNKWADLLQVNRKYLGPEGAAAYRDWIRSQIAKNRPYDEFVRSIVAVSGSNRKNPAASYYKILREPSEIAETTTQLFLAIRFNCNKCHDHPFERWTQDQYYQTAAYFAQVRLQPDPESKGRKIGGSAVEGAKPFYEFVSDGDSGEMVHDRTQQIAPPRFPFPCNSDVGESTSRRQAFAQWLTSADNPYFARSYVNRLWGYLFGIGIIQPIDDIRAGNPPSNPELLDYLTRQFVDNGFDVRHIVRRICKSRTYQLSVATNRWNVDDSANYAHAIARRLPAEVLFDAMHEVTGAVPKIPGVPPGTRAVQLPDVGIALPSGFLATLGRPARESACECERSNEIQLGPVMAMISGPVVADAIADPNNALAKLVVEEPDDRKLVDALFLRILNRHAHEDEYVVVQELLKEIDADHQKLTAQLKQAEARWAARRPELQAAREKELAATRQDLEVYEKQIAPATAAKERDRTHQIAAAEKALEAIQAQFAEKFKNWANERVGTTEWHLLRPSQLAASNGAQLTAVGDRSIRAEGKAEKGVYTVAFRTQLQGITAVRLEALPVAGIKGGGPGLPENGNFVVTEVEVRVASASKPEDFKPVSLERPQADFAQQGFDVKQVTDGVTQDQRGWAVHPAGGVVHWATFQTKQPIGGQEGSVIQLRIHQFHNAKDHRLARFRLSAATTTQPVGVSLPESLASILATGDENPSERQKKEIAEYFRKTDAEYLKRQTVLAEARKPLPVDPGLKSRRATIEELSKPIADDPALVQLRTDAQVSAAQVADRRLTAAQDLAWALINSPAFLFNH